MKCAHCYSTDVWIVDSYEDRDVVVVRCRACSKCSELDTEHELSAEPTVKPS